MPAQGGPLPSNLSGGGQVWAHDRLFAAARDRSRNSVSVMMYAIGHVRSGVRVIHRSAWGGANGRIVKDICPPASPGNGKGPP